ncbi:MAG TPA: transcriptional regulator [Micromonosporaceae bacterium]|nr:transcriptional regulator [Micromonosporaceae bacterium]
MVSAATVASRLAEGRALYDNGRHTQLVARLPDLLAAAHQRAEAAAGPAMWATVASCYELATHALSKLGRHESSRLTADRAMTYARLSESAVAVALSSRALSIVLRHQGRPHLAQRVNLDALTEVEATGLATPAQRTVFVQMLCSTAYAAAQSGDKDRALELTGEADRALRLLPEQPDHPATPVNATALTPAQVHLYKVGMHWSLGDSASALDAARSLHPAQFPTAERRGRLFTDVARAWWQHDRPEQTATTLLAAYRQASAEVVDRPAIRKIATDLIDRHPRVVGVRELRAILRPNRTH